MNRTYQMMSAGIGTVALGTVSALDPKTAQLMSHDYPIGICMCGPTSARPQAGDPDIPCPNGQPQGGIYFLDVTLGFIVVADGQGGWRNPASGASV